MAEVPRTGRRVEGARRALQRGANEVRRAAGAVAKLDSIKMVHHLMVRHILLVHHLMVRYI